MTNNPASQDIVRDEKGRFIVGQSGNPTGNPAGTAVSLISILKRRLREHPEDAEAIVEAHIKQGKARDMRAITELYDRIDGKVVETHKIEGELPIKILFVPAEQLKGGQYAIEQGQKQGENEENQVAQANLPTAGD